MTQLIDSARITGALQLHVYNPDGSLKGSTLVKNLVVASGLTYAAQRLKGDAVTAMGWVALGTGTTAAAPGDTTLQTEVGRVALSNTTTTGNQVVYTATFGAGVAVGPITEAGIFNAATGGVMLARTVFGVVTRGPNDTMGATWTITFNG